MYFTYGNSLAGGFHVSRWFLFILLRSQQKRLGLERVSCVHKFMTAHLIVVERFQLKQSDGQTDPHGLP